MPPALKQAKTDLLLYVRDVTSEEILKKARREEQNEQKRRKCYGEKQPIKCPFSSRMVRYG
jgi:hypothetical protein